jgi:hypothetical protein
VVAGLVVVQGPGGDLLHFDTLGYVLVCTTVISLTMMYFIDQRIRAERADPAPPNPTGAPIAVPD